MRPAVPIWSCSLVSLLAMPLACDGSKSEDSDASDAGIGGEGEILATPELRRISEEVEQSNCFIGTDAAGVPSCSWLGEAAMELFADAVVDLPEANPSYEILYPPDDAPIPKNVGSLLLQWRGIPGAVKGLIRLLTPAATYHLYDVVYCNSNGICECSLHANEVGYLWRHHAGERVGLEVVMSDGDSFVRTLESSVEVLMPSLIATAMTSEVHSSVLTQWIHGGSNQDVRVGDVASVYGASKTLGMYPRGAVSRDGSRWAHLALTEAEATSGDLLIASSVGDEAPTSVVAFVECVVCTQSRWRSGGTCHDR